MFKNFFKKFKKDRRGFTLIEIMVAAAIFATIVIIVSELFASALKEQHSSFNVQQVEENLTYMLERITKEIRVSTILIPDTDTADSCVDTLAISHPDNGVIKYYRSTGSDGRSDAHRYVLPADSDPDSTDGEDSLLNTNMVDIVDLKFCVMGNSSSDELQPRVTIIGGIRVGSSGKVDRFQTTISLRQIQE